MAKPVIGLTTTRILNKEGLPTSAVNLPYTRSISLAGGVPVLIPNELPEDDVVLLIKRLDGFVFTGGHDIDPKVYGSQPHPTVQHIDADRDRLECQLLQASIEAGKPFLGICRGLQVINVALGGSIYEDLPSQFTGNIHHDNHDKPRNHLAHGVEVERDTLLAQILSDNPTQVNSLHHQGIRRLASNLHPVAFSPDGLVEAIELLETPFGLAVQWHPEELQEYASMRKLFQAFIQSCHTIKPDITNQED